MLRSTLSIVEFFLNASHQILKKTEEIENRRQDFLNIFITPSKLLQKMKYFVFPYFVIRSEVLTMNAHRDPTFNFLCSKAVNSEAVSRQARGKLN